ncbi:peptidoglycan-binding protein [Bosea sp. RAF48]|uniref:peptidoglycan-binding domain-containing protein n=1 Tax=Bosea sp. RAF48 TaxID=3237480 RepID=UPI003F8FCE22
MAFSEYADWWDKQKRETEKILGEWVQDNPQWWAVAVATTVQTSMDLGAGYVDVLRFGQGMAEGGLAGVGKDGLRLLALLGPMGKAGGMFSRLIHMQRIRFAVQVQGVTGPCTFQAVNNAMSIARGRSYFVTLKEMAKAVGRPLKSITKDQFGVDELGAHVKQAMDFMIAQGVKVRQLQARSIQGVTQLAKSQDGVTVFAIRCVTTRGEPINHTVIAVRDALGRVRFADYGGRYHATLESLVESLNYGAVNKAGINLMEGQAIGAVKTLGVTGLMEQGITLFKGVAFVIEGMTAIETLEGVDFAAPVVVAATSAPTKSDPAPPEVVKASFDAFKQRKRGKTVIQLPEMVIKAGEKAAPKAALLTGVQFRLNALGFGAGPVDGIKGPKTTKAVKAFQKTYPPLKVDGVPGSKTQDRLVEICGF